MSAASPVIPVPTGSKRPMAAGSSSICRMALYGAIPVWLAKEAPTTISRSASFISQLATGVPLRPSTPAPSGWVSGIRPLALKVVRTGALSRSARRRSGPVACRAPCPAISTGRLLAEIMAAARASSGWLGWVRRPASRPCGVLAAASLGWVWTSSGSTRWATPRASRACLTARAASSAWSLPACTSAVQAATSRKMAVRSRSWKAPRPRTLEGTWPEMARTGDRSSLASYRPVSMLVDPGPAMAKHAAGRPVSLPYALAAKAAAPSCRIPV